MNFSLASKITSPVFLALVVIALTGLFVSLSPISPISKKLPVPAVNFEEISYPSRVWQERVLKNVQAAASEKDTGKRFELYSLIFTDLSAIYARDHQAKTRGELESLTSFIAKEFSDQYKAENFNVPCLDLVCGTASYPAEIEQIKAKLSEIESFDPYVLDNVLKKLEAAALSTDPNLQWQNYLGAFQQIKAEKTRTNDAAIAAVGGSLKEFMKAQYPETYSQWERNFPDSFEIDKI